MATNNLNSDLYDLSAAEHFITGKRPRKVPALYPPVTHEKKLTYGKAAGVVARYLRDKRLLCVANTPKAKALLAAMLKSQGLPARVIQQRECRNLILAFAAQIEGREPPSTAPVALERTKARRTEPAVAVKSPSFYWTDEWRRVRYQALRSSRGVCELCGVAPSRGKPLHVDHIKPRSKHPELELELKNLQVLCDDCNLGKGNRDEIDWRRGAAAS